MSILPGRIPAYTEPLGNDSAGGNVQLGKNWFLYLYGLSSYSPGAALQTPTVTDSPFTFTASADGTVLVSGGAVTDIAVGRSGKFVDTGQTTGQFVLHFQDQIRITYTAAPTVTFFPNS